MTNKSYKAIFVPLELHKDIKTISAGLGKTMIEYLQDFIEAEKLFRKVKKSLK